jgi:ribokinase
MLVVFGSINVDLVARVPRLPRRGETLAGSRFAMVPGGKGANQALAAARAGAAVGLFGCVGRDAMAPVALRNLREAGIDVSGVRDVDAPTGVALIHVDDAGENCITIVAGANAHARAAQVPDAVLGSGTTLLLQLEVNAEEVAALAARARSRGARIILNAAPAQPLPAGLFDAVDVLVVNESEASVLAGGGDSEDARSQCLRLVGSGRGVVVTCGARGAVYARRKELHEQPALRIDVVDTVGAGDACTAAIAAALDRGEELAQAVREGVAAGSLACLREGAQDAAPAREQITRVAATLPSPNGST